jgi:hypothetical protein
MLRFSLKAAFFQNRPLGRFFHACRATSRHARAVIFSAESPVSDSCRFRSSSGRRVNTDVFIGQARLNFLAREVNGADLNRVTLSAGCRPGKGRLPCGGLSGAPQDLVAHALLISDSRLFDPASFQACSMC